MNQTNQSCTETRNRWLKKLGSCQKFPQLLPFIKWLLYKRVTNFFTISWFEHSFTSSGFQPKEMSYPLQTIFRTKLSSVISPRLWHACLTSHLLVSIQTGKCRSPGPFSKLRFVSSSRKQACVSVLSITCCYHHLVIPIDYQCYDEKNKPKSNCFCLVCCVSFFCDHHSTAVQ